MPGILLEMERIQKYFPGVHALNDARLDLYAGEVLALVGENGAGKSTLMKVLTGVYGKDGGEIRFQGKPVEIRNTRDSQALGISIIHQELNLMPDLTVAENIYIGREPMKGFRLDKRRQNADAQKLLNALGLRMNPGVTVKSLSVAKQQMVEIARALSYPNTKVLIMDEPSAALSEAEIEELFVFIRELKKKGIGIIYISHRMQELKVIADRVTVMRDGQYVGTRPMDQVTMDEIVSMMVGRVIYEQPKETSQVPSDAPVVLEARNLSSPAVKDVSFALRRGEILGFAGLMGAGRTETMRLVCGADPKDGGTVLVGGKAVEIKTPEDGVKAGIGYLSEDRKRYGLCLGLSVADNMALPSLKRFTKAFVVRKKPLHEQARDYQKQINIKTPGVTSQVVSLSGGNQQKVVLAKWLMKNCDILIFDEPTRGIDVGAKNEIYKLMNRLVSQGKSIIMISSELPELLRLSDRIAVMCEGRITGEIKIEDATQEKIMALATPGV